MSNVRYHMPFIERVLAGEVLEPEIAVEEEIAQWHSYDTGNTLPVWLGMSEKEYALFVEQPAALRPILHARATGSDLHTVLSAANETTLAARGADAAELARLKQWLQSTGRL